MKKIIALILAALTACTVGLSLTACSSSKDEGKIYVGLECGYIPFNWTQMDDANGGVKISNAEGYANGYDVMIAKSIAQSLGKELVVVKYEWDALVGAVVSGSLDFIIAGMSPTEERLEAIDFSDAYYDSQLVIVVKEGGNYADAKELKDFGGATIVAQKGTFHETALKTQGPQFGINVGTSMDTFPLMTAALSVGTIDGYVAEEPGAIADCSATSGLTYVRLENNKSGFTASAEDTTIAVGFKKGSAYKDRVNAALATITQEQRAEMMNNAIKYSVGAIDAE